MLIQSSSVSEIGGLVRGLAKTTVITTRSAINYGSHCRRFPETIYMGDLNVQYRGTRIGQENNL